MVILLGITWKCGQLKGDSLKLQQSFYDGKGQDNSKQGSEGNKKVITNLIVKEMIFKHIAYYQ